MPRSFTATCAPGLEEALAAELHGLGLAQVRPGRRAVTFAGPLADGYRACLWSRVASRVLLPLAQVYAADARSLYAEVRRGPWLDHLGPDSTLAVHFVGTSPAIRSSHFGALKVKDAIVDVLRERTGRRPSVDLDNPDVRVHVFLHRTRATVSIDLSGDPLHLRGLGRDGGPAPLKETLAAGILRYAGWPRAGALVDPMCGSGTFLLEAAGMLADRAPGLTRPRWGFTGWRGHDPRLWRSLVQEAEARVRPLPEARLFGADADPEQVRRAVRNLAAAGVDTARVQRRDLADAGPPTPEPGLIVTNPPYGERLGDDAAVQEVWRTLGDVLRRRFLGWTAFVLAGSREGAKALGLRPASRRPLFNGPLEARLLELPISARPVARDRA
ncbi:MAG: hypothetical protein H6739_16885 [Alphaproteobacteria bacterium]|nr:hypothetical protein [Alphaproteobacteria bacterium]